MSRLSSKDVKMIRALYGMGVNNSTLAKAYAVHTSTISYHTCNKTFRDKQGRYLKKLIADDRDDKVILHVQSLMDKYENKIKERNEDIMMGGKHVVYR